MADADKKVRTLQKKLREIAALEEKGSQGESLDKLQEAKIQKRAEIEAQIKAALEESEPPEGGSNPTASEEGLYMTHLIDVIRGLDDKQRRRAKYFRTKNGLAWKEDYLGAFVVQKPETSTTTKDKAKFDLICDFEFYLWSSWPSTFDCIKTKIREAVGVAQRDFHFESVDGERIPFDADCFEKFQELSARQTPSMTWEKKPLVTIKVVPNRVDQ